ncbi:MAG: hypothetical protein ACI8PZ_004157 [Myxococcota bacterium]|jgi:hypothetical protein
MVWTLLLLGCASTPSGSGGAGAATDPTVPTPPVGVEDCADGVDNDGDQHVDCVDPDCAGQCIELCGDGADNDGDGLTDCADADCAAPTCAEDCADGVDNDADGLTDCADPACDVAACPEVCGDGRDNDADGAADCADPDCPTCTELCDDGVDGDADGLVDCADPDCAAICDADGDGFVAQALGGDDCDDRRSDVHPARREICNLGEELDDDCDGLVDLADPDLDVSTLRGFSVDGDGDGFGGDGDVVWSCVGEPGWGRANTDCDDADPVRYVGALEVCDGVDNDCDDLVDDDDPGVDSVSAPEWFPDVDGDGYGWPVDGIVSCPAVPGRVANGDDCDDTDPRIGPPTRWLPDGDGDGFGAGDPVPGAPSCDAPEPGLGPAWAGEDCDDGDPRVNPGAIDVCEDGYDQDCDGEDAECIAPNPECVDHVVLDEAHRNVDYGYDFARCDDFLPEGWYRFDGAAGSAMPEWGPPTYSCGTHAPGWVDGVAPADVGDTVDVDVCFHWDGGVCNWTRSIQITNCGDFLVYELGPPPVCSLAYCAE